MPDDLHETFVLRLPLMSDDAFVSILVEDDQRPVTNQFVAIVEILASLNSLQTVYRGTSKGWPSRTLTKIMTILLRNGDGKNNL
jgi:hypothetical protein